MARMSSKVLREFDAASAITLRDATDGAETATAAETAVDLNTLTAAYWDNHEQTNGVFVISVYVEAITFPGADEVYTLAFQVDTTAGNFGGNEVEVARIAAIPATGYYEVVVSSQLINALKSGAQKLRAKLTVNSGAASSGESITYGAWMTYLAV